MVKNIYDSKNQGMFCVLMILKHTTVADESATVMLLVGKLRKLQAYLSKSFP